MFPASPTFDTVGPLRAERGRRGVGVRRAGGVRPGRSDLVPRPRPRGAPPDRLRVGVAGGFFAGALDPEVERAVDEAVSALRPLVASVEPVELAGATEASRACGVISASEALAHHGERLAQHPDWLGEDVRRRLELGRSLTGADCAAALEVGRRWRREVEQLFERVDVVACATTPVPAPAAADAEMIGTTRQLTRLTFPWSLACVPALSVPCRPTLSGLPVGLQLVAAEWGTRPCSHSARPSSK